MIYCIHCGHQVDENLDTCPVCGQPLVKRELEYEEIRELNRALHNREQKSREKVDNELVYIVLGTTLLIIGALFFFLSFKVNQDTFEKELTFTTPEFWVSMTGLSVGGFLLVWGLVNLIIQKVVVQREINRTLKLTQNESYVHLPQK